MASGVVHDAFHQEEDENVLQLLKTLEEECRQLRPPPSQLANVSNDGNPDFPSSSAFLLELMASGPPEEANDEDVLDDEILDIARELQLGDLRPLEEWVGCTQQWLQKAQAVRAEIEEISGMLNQLIDINSQVGEKSSFLTKNAAGLIAEKDGLEKVAQQIETKLRYFEKVDTLAKDVSNPNLDPYSDQFHNILTELDDVIDFLNQNRHYKSAASYVSRVHIVQQRALMVLRDLIVTACQSIQSELQHSETFTKYINAPPLLGSSVAPSTSTMSLSNSSVDAMASANGEKSDPTEQSDKPTLLGLVEVLNVEFQAKLDGVLPLIKQLEQRCIERKDSNVYLNDILAVYYDCRVGLLSPILGHYLTSSCKGAEGPLMVLVEQGIPYLLAISLDECKLFHQFFSLQTVNAHLKNMVEGIGMIMYEKFRSYVLKVDDLRELAQVIDNLRNTLLLGKLKSAGEGGQLLSGVIHKMIQDAQERFIFRSSMFIKNAIGNYRFTYSDLTPYLRVPGITATCLDKDQHFPTLANTLSLLKLMFGAVEKGVFEGLAQEAITICTELLLRAYDIIVSQKGKDKVEWPTLEGCLFLVRHLLTLREHIIPYDANLTTVEKHLDFSQLMQSRQVAIQEMLRDPKKDLEAHLKKYCEKFIGECSEKLVAELSPFTLKVQSETKGNVPTGTVSLQASSSAQFHTLKKEYVAVMDELKARVQTYVVLLKFYLPNPLSMNILFRPIKGSLMEAYQQLYMALGAFTQKYNTTQHSNESNPAMSPKDLLHWAEEQERQANSNVVTAPGPTNNLFPFDLKAPSFSMSAPPTPSASLRRGFAPPDVLRTSSFVSTGSGCPTPVHAHLDSMRPPPLLSPNATSNPARPLSVPAPSNATRPTAPSSAPTTVPASTIPTPPTLTSNPLSSQPPMPSLTHTSSNGSLPHSPIQGGTPTSSQSAPSIPRPVVAPIPKPTLKPSVGGSIPKPTLKPSVGTGTSTGRLLVPKPQPVLQKAATD